MTAMGRTNDAIIYGGRVHLFVTGPADDAKALAEALPSRASRDYGAPFRDIFKRFKGDFYAIDPMLFSPAETLVTAIESGADVPRRRGRRGAARRLVRLNLVARPTHPARQRHARLARAAHGGSLRGAGRRSACASTSPPAAFRPRARPGSISRASSTLPDAVHVRTMAAGSFEAITKRLGVLHALERLGVRVRECAARDRGLRR